ncbi:unnamed protein product, partial [Rangifer tarandus platyrhynchus]
MGQIRLHSNQSEGPEDGLRSNLPQNRGDPAWWGWGNTCCGGGPGRGGLRRGSHLRSMAAQQQEESWSHQES